MLNIVLPIAGRGGRFVHAGYTVPKPLIPIHGMPMVEVVVNNLRPSRPQHFIFLALKEHLDRTDMQAILKRIAPDCTVIPVAEVTEGAACTVLLAKDYINNHDPLMVANCDQWVDIDINDYLAELDRQHADGLIMTMWADHPKWSYARLDTHGRVVEVVEKEVVSNEATVGIYNFRHGRDYVRAVEQMIAKNLRVKNEFYVAPVYNQLIETGGKVVVYNIGKVGDGMYGMGDPTDLEEFKKIEASKRATRHWGAAGFLTPGGAT